MSANAERGHTSRALFLSRPAAPFLSRRRKRTFRGGGATPKYLVGAALLGIVLGSVYLYWSHNRRLDVAADRGVHAFADADASTLFALCAPGEVQRTGLTETKLRQILASIVRPALGKLKLDRDRATREPLNDPPTEGVAVIPARLPDGTRADLLFMTWPTEHGPRAAVLSDLLSQAWCLSYEADHPEEFRRGKANPGLMKLAGLRRDRAFLEGAGVTGIVSPGNIYRSWDQLEREWARQAKASASLIGP